MKRIWADGVTKYCLQVYLLMIVKMSYSTQDYNKLQVLVIPAHQYSITPYFKHFTHLQIDSMNLFHY